MRGLGSAIIRGGLYELCYLSVILRHIKIFCKGAHKYYMTKNVGFSRCIYVLGITLADVILLLKTLLFTLMSWQFLCRNLKNLTDLYQNQMILHEAATKDTKYVHATRLKNQILQHLPCLRETKKWKFKFLTLKSEMGRALLEAC